MRARSRSGSPTPPRRSSPTTSSTPSCAARRRTAPSGCAGSRASATSSRRPIRGSCERSEGLARWDGGGAVGYVALAEALDHEADAGASTAPAWSWSARCFPTGRLGWFAERVARRGLLCLLVATSTPRIVHPDGGPPLLGTNPICLALPGADGPTVVDVSMGRVTYGTVLHAAATGAPLPEGAARRARRLGRDRPAPR